MTVYERMILRADGWTRQAILAAACGDIEQSNRLLRRAEAWDEKALALDIESADKEA